MMHRSNIIAAISTVRNSTPRQRYLSFGQRQHQSTTQNGDSARQVETPVQSQPGDRIVQAPLTLEPHSAPAQTPIQSQNPANFNPLATQSTRPPLNNTGPIFVLFAGLVTVPLILYTYYEYRKEHMEQKWEGMLKDAQQKRQQG